MLFYSELPGGTSRVLRRRRRVSKRSDPQHGAQPIEGCDDMPEGLAPADLVGPREAAILQAEHDDEGRRHPDPSRDRSSSRRAKKAGDNHDDQRCFEAFTQDTEHGNLWKMCKCCCDALSV